MGWHGFVGWSIMLPCELLFQIRLLEQSHMVKAFKKKQTVFDVLVLVIGHNHPEFLADTADSFVFYHPYSSYGIAFAIDYNIDCATVLSGIYGDSFVYCSKSQNGWGRGILRTMVHALDYFYRNGIRWNHLITVDSDALIVGPCLDRYLELIEPGVCFVGQKWGGDGPYSSDNPGPTKKSQRHVKYFYNLGLFEEKWELLDYMVAGPFVLWTRECLDFMRRIGLTPGSALDEIYPFIIFPHDQMSTLILGVEGHEFKDVGKVSLLHCGDVGGDETWKGGLPSRAVEVYGEIPIVESGVGVIHPIRTKNLSEGKIRAFFRKQRI